MEDPGLLEELSRVGVSTKGHTKLPDAFTLGALGPLHVRLDNDGILMG
jgi:hypothetical protein